jgi:hypothetical protein
VTIVVVVCLHGIVRRGKAGAKGPARHCFSYTEMLLYFSPLALVPVAVIVIPAGPKMEANYRGETRN